MQLFAVTPSALSSKCRRALSHATQLQTALRATKSGARALQNQLKSTNSPLEPSILNHFKWFFLCFLPRNAPSSPQKSWLPRLAAMRLVASSASLHCLRAASAPTAAPRWKPLSRSDRDSSNSSRKARRLPRSAFVALRARKESMAQRCEPHAASLGAAAFPPRRLRRAHAYRNPAGKRTSQANRHNYIMLINVN